MATEEIYASLPIIPPALHEKVITIHPAAPVCLPGRERWFTMNAEVFNNLQCFEWYQITCPARAWWR